MNCRICGNAADNTEYSVKEMMFGLPESFKYLKCGSCGCLQIEKIPSDMQKYYPGNYYSYFSLEERPPYKDIFTKFSKAKKDYYAITGLGLTGRLLSLFKKRREFLMLSNLGLDTRSRILDVGCGNGGKLYSLANAGFKNLLGIDPFIKEGISYKIGFEVRKQAIFEIDGIWDLIMFNHSFEHIEESLNVLKKAGSLISDKGTCLIRIPVSDSYAFEKYGVNWVQLDAPRHFYLHTVKSMGYMAEKAGLRLDRIEYEGDEFGFWGSEQYAKGINLFSDYSYSVDREKSGFSNDDIDAYKKKAAELNAEKKGDSAAFYFVKK